MKKSAFPVLCALLLISTVAFAILWRQEAARNEDNLNRLWLSAAAAGETAITEYQQGGGGFRPVRLPLGYGLWGMSFIWRRAPGRPTLI